MATRDRQNVRENRIFSKAIENICALLLVGAKLVRRLGDRRHTRTGGINEINLTSYLQLNSTFALGGSWMFSSKLFGEDQINDVYSKCLNLKKVLENG